MILITEELANLMEIETGEALVLRKTENGKYYLDKMDLREAFIEVEKQSTGMSSVLSVEVFLRVE